MQRRHKLRVQWFKVWSEGINGTGALMGGDFFQGGGGRFSLNIIIMWGGLKLIFLLNERGVWLSFGPYFTHFPAPPPPFRLLLHSPLLYFRYSSQFGEHSNAPIFCCVCSSVKSKHKIAATLFRWKRHFGRRMFDIVAPSAHVVACVITAVLFVRLCGEERCVTTHRTAVNLSSTCEWLTHRIRIHSGINNDKCSIYNNRLPDDCMSTTINKLFATKLKVWCSVYLKVDTKRWWCGHKCIFMIMRVFKLLNKLVNVAKTYW